MSLTRPPQGTKYVASHAIDALVLGALTFVCLAGLALTPDTSQKDTILVESDAVDDLKPAIPEIALNNLSPLPDGDHANSDDTAPNLLANKPPTDIAPKIKLSKLPELAAGDLISSGSGFISLMGSDYDSTNWHRSTHATGNDFQATNWNADHAVYDADGLSLKLDHAPDRPDEFLGGEIQSRKTYGHGRYEILMQPAKASGTVSSFFTYTGPYKGNPHDEIDIEFLGEDTTKIHLNYFRNGRVGEHITVDLPFDAGDSLHLYAFEWRPDAITWFVDDHPIHQTKLGDRQIPTTPGAILVNLWSGKPRLRSWHGQPDFTETVEANYGCISFQPLGSETRSCSKIFPPKTIGSQPTVLASVQQTSYPNENGESVLSVSYGLFGNALGLLTEND